ncbi:GGDEF domain-containing protein [Deinococcus sp. A31D244]|uniref:GGDEF domain-containing protein n=1 Tax=Deinococcus sp. A31D244 TaxID=3397675 RepID=UPI0039E15604
MTHPTPDAPCQPSSDHAVGLAWAARDDSPERASLLSSAELGGPCDAQAGVTSGYLLWRDGALPQAVERIGRSLMHLRQQPPSVWLGRGLNILAALQSQLNRPDLAVSLYEEQLTLARSIHDPELLATALHDLGVELRFSDPERARQHITDSITAFRNLKYDFGVAVAHLNLAEAEQYSGHPHEALGHVQAALTYPLLRQHPLMAAELQATLFGVYHALGDPRAAGSAAELRALTTHPHPEVHLTAALALAAHAAPPEAAALLEAALQRARELGSHTLLPAVHEQLSAAHARQGHHDRALHHLHETLRLTRERHAAERHQSFQSFEVLQRIQALQEVAEQERTRNTELSAHLQELRALNSRIRELGRTDHLTQLFNREHLFNEGERLVLSATGRTPLAGAIIDIDHFKRINDTWGHQLGDAVLRQLADLIRAAAQPGDLPARYGGEEFVLLRPGATATQLAVTCRALNAHVQQHPWHTLTPDLRVTVSIGVADTTTPDLDTMLGTADRRLYSVKRSGRNAVQHLD